MIWTSSIRSDLLDIVQVKYETIQNYLSEWNLFSKRSLPGFEQRKVCNCLVHRINKKQLGLTSSNRISYREDSPTAFSVLCDSEPSKVPRRHQFSKEWCTPHYFLLFCLYWDWKYANCGMERAGSISCFPFSLDLTLSGSFLLRFWKDIVYYEPPPSKIHSRRIESHRQLGLFINTIWKMSTKTWIIVHYLPW